MYKDKKEQKMFFKPVSECSSYKDKIKPLLIQLATQTINKKQLIQTLKLFKLYSTNQQLYNGQYYQILQKAWLQEELNVSILLIFKQISQYILNMQTHFDTHLLPILQGSHNATLTLTKHQIFYLMCLLITNLVPTQLYASTNNPNRQSYSLSNTFSFILSHQQYKAKCILNYFIYHFKNIKQWKLRNQKFIIRRKYLTIKNIQQLINKNPNLQMISYQLKSNKQSIQDFSQCGKVDFANQYIGGGALHFPCVQQEIMFANASEMYISMIFCQSMNQNQSLYFQGFRKFSNNIGYGHKTSFDSNYKINQNKFYAKQQHVVAIDAICYPNGNQQFKKKLIDRQLIKAYAGFSNLPDKVNSVATGNWGCGAFGGQITVKFIIQWLACCLAEKKMIYCPFGQYDLINKSQKVLKQLRKKKVKQVYNILLIAGQRMKQGETNIFKKIQKVLQEQKYKK